MARIKDILAFVVSALAFSIVIVFYAWLLFDVFQKGISVLLKAGFRFFTDIPPLPNDGIGGISTVLIGSLYMTFMASLIAAPLAFATALYVTLYERSRLAGIVRELLNIMVEFPTIIVGITVFLIFSVTLGLGLNALVASIALSFIMLPYVAIQAVEILKQGKAVLMEPAYAIGLKEHHVIRLLLSYCRNGLITAFLIGFAKAIGETAPLLFTTTMAFNVFLTSPTSPVTGIPVLIFVYALSPYDNWREVAWGAAFVLMLIIMSIYTIAVIAFRRGGRS